VNEKEVLPFLAPFCGEVRVPGSKSITNRIFPLSVIFSHGELIHIKNALVSEDVEIMRNALVFMGANIVQRSESPLDWDISSGTFWDNSSKLEIFCGNSGTTLRFLSAIALLRKGKTIFRGIERMHERPIGDLCNALEQLGADVVFLKKKEFPPFCITPPKEFFPRTIILNASLSSQFLSSILHILPLFPEKTILQIDGKIVSAPYIQMTLSILEKFFGMSILHDEIFRSFSFFQKKEDQIQREISIEVDASSASYPLALFALTRGSGKILGIGSKSLQGDALFAERVLKAMGVKVNYDEHGISVSAPNTLLPLGEISLEDMPDVAMTAVVLAAYAKGYSKISGLSTLRHKECDRIIALVQNLTVLGAIVREGEDYIEIFGDPTLLHGGIVEPFNDHRVAMCFAVLGSVVHGIHIRTPECVEKTYPSFWEDLEQWRSRSCEKKNF
jgi:3-phosphoshikimate 1-carboxyvinyltransferase